MYPPPPAHTEWRGFLHDRRNKAVAAVAGENPGPLTSGHRTAADDGFRDVSRRQRLYPVKVDLVPEGMPHGRGAD